MKIKERKTNLRELNCGLEMHEQRPHEEQQPDARAAARHGLDRRTSGSTSGFLDREQFQHREQFQ